MNEEKIKEYVKGGGKLWHIDKISTIRDGGTIILTDENEREYIYDRLDSYLKGCENSVRLANRVIENLNDIKII